MINILVSVTFKILSNLVKCSWAFQTWSHEPRIHIHIINTQTRFKMIVWLCSYRSTCVHVGSETVIPIQCISLISYKCYVWIFCNLKSRWYHAIYFNTLLIILCMTFQTLKFRKKLDWIIKQARVRSRYLSACCVTLVEHRQETIQLAVPNTCKVPGNLTLKVLFSMNIGHKFDNNWPCKRIIVSGHVLYVSPLINRILEVMWNLVNELIIA